MHWFSHPRGGCLFLLCALFTHGFALGAPADPAAPADASRPKELTGAEKPATPDGASRAFPAEPSDASPSPAPAAALTAPAAPVPVSPTRNDQWQRDYTTARAELIAGHFALAAEQFRTLAATALDPFDRRLALEQAALALEWSNRRLVLTVQSDAQPAHSETSTERSTDEISILYTNAAIYGIGSGIALAAITEPDSAAGGILPTLAIAGAAAGAVAVADMNPHRLHYGVPQSMVSGMYIGLEEGVTWVLWNQARARYYDEWKPSTVATLIWGAATVGAGVGAAVGTLRGTTPGRASFVGSTALWAGAIAGLTAGAFGSDDDARDDHALLAAAIGVNAGAVLGMVAAGPVSPSIARVRFLDLGAVGGGLVFGGLYIAMADKNTEPGALMATTAAGVGAGLATAWLATGNMSPDLGPEQAKPSVVQSLRPTFAPVHGGAMLAVAGSL